MANKTKLKNLEVTNVDFVDEGANKRADILITKRKNPVKAAFVSLGKALGLVEDDDQEPEEEQIDKSAQTFTTSVAQEAIDTITDETWDICRALYRSICSAMTDAEMDSTTKLQFINQQIDSFATTIKTAAVSWTAYKPAGITKSKELEEEDAPADKAVSKNKDLESETKGELEDMMKIDKSKMSAEELAQYEALVKKYAVENNEAEPEDVSKNQTAEQKKEASESKDVSKSKTPETEETDIYKGLNPAIRAEIDELKKFKAAAEEKELRAVAKKYELLGKKEDEMYDTLKKAKDAGVYDTVVSSFDAALEAVKQSGAFDEIGKSAHGTESNDAEQIVDKINKSAAELMKKDPSLSHEDAVAKAWENDPEAYDAYDALN